MITGNAARIAASFLLCSSALALDIGGDRLAALVGEKSPALVTIKYVLKMSMGPMGESESETEIMGVMIEPTGLVLTSNTQISGMSSVMRRFMRGGDMTSTPKDLKVLAGDDTEGVEAELVARDSELDLAWVRVRKSPEKPYAAIDLSKSAKVKLGDEMVYLRRLSKYFDRAAIASTARVGGTTTKPRELLVPTAQLGTFGVPAFTESGALVGISVLQMPDDDDANPMSSMMRAQDGMGLILPAEEVAKATKRAMETVK
ncbi:MAG: serine protease [Phycisphaerae bacterium]